LRILQKSGDEVVLLATPGDDVSVGEYLLVEGERGRALVVQVYDLTFLEYPGMLEDLVREEVVGTLTEGQQKDPLQIVGVSRLIRDMRLVRCKARGTIVEGRFTHDVAWLPSRVDGRVQKASIRLLWRAQGRKFPPDLIIGRVGEERYGIDWDDIDGRLSIVLGRKESGKSHLAKLLVSKLVEAGANMVIFDLNGEYGGLALYNSGDPSPLADKLETLSPGRNFRFTLRDLGLTTLASILEHSLDTPPVTMRDFIRLWHELSSKQPPTLRGLMDLIHGSRINEHVREALLSRLQVLASTGMVGDEGEGSFRFETRFSPQGKALIVPLRHMTSVQRKIAVEITLSKTVELLARRRIPPVFLFAEEAQLYLRETHWDDLVTRMRHYGVFPIFITNQPDALSQTVYRQADNLFLFHMANEKDLEDIAKFMGLDRETVVSVAKTLYMGRCMVLGRAARGLPMVVSIDPLQYRCEGQTNYFMLWKAATTT
jgi:hypothetical protein